MSVVIPTWNGARLLRDALHSLREQTFRDFEVVVVDNGSTDDTLPMLETDFGDVRVVALPENVGFAGAVNAGIEASEGEIVALLNNDAEAAPGWLGALVGALDEDPGIGSCASKILDHQDRTLVDSAGDCLGVFAFQRGHGEPDGPVYATPAVVLSACAGAAAYRKSVLAELGGFDERYFAYFEDVDLGVRAVLAGHTCVYVPDAIAYHRGSATARRISDRAFYLRSRNAMMLGYQYLPAWRLAVFGPVLVVWPFVRALVDGQRLGTAWRAARDFWAQRSHVARRRREMRARGVQARSRLTALLEAPWARGGILRRGRPTPGEPKPTTDRPVDVVVVNWNGRRYLPACLEALRASTAPVRVMVVDNASGDDSVHYVRTSHPWAEVVALDRNTGYAAGANEGLRRARGDFAVVMNADALLTPDYVGRLVERMRSDPSIGIAQGKLRQLDAEAFAAHGSVDDEGRSVAARLASAQRLDSAGHVIVRSRRVFDRAQGAPDAPEFGESASVFSASGAAFLLRRAMWEDVAPDGEVFDEAFFAYKEDIDLCWRARWLGWEVLYAPEAEAGHVRAWGGAGLPPKERVSAVARRHSWKNHYLLMVKNDRLGHLLLHLPWLLGWEVARQGYALVRDWSVYRSYADLLRRLPDAWRARRDLRGRSRVSPADMRRWFGAEPVVRAEAGSVEAGAPVRGLAS